MLNTYTIIFIGMWYVALVVDSLEVKSCFWYSKAFYYLAMFIQPGHPPLQVTSPAVKVKAEAI